MYQEIAKLDDEDLNLYSTSPWISRAGHVHCTYHAREYHGLPAVPGTEWRGRPEVLPSPAEASDPLSSSDWWRVYIPPGFWALKVYNPSSYIQR